MSLTLDTNVLVYVADQRDPAKQAVAQALVEALARRGSRIALQAVGEMQNALHRRLKRPVWEAAQAARNVMTAFGTFPYGRAEVERALAEAAAGRFGYWDALLLSASEAAGATVVFSEDMADRGRFGRLEVVNPFSPHGMSERARELIAS